MDGRKPNPPVGRKKRSLRFFFALFFAKGTALVLKLIGRKGTSMPGSWAIILCPDFLARMPRPKTVLAITGTNGKTTVSNMVEDVLSGCGYDFVCNRAGTNVHTGVASALIANSTLFGKPKKKELAVFEVDERSAGNILPQLQPDILLCTNIFQDSFKRNAHPEFIVDILSRHIPGGTRLVLNADDLLCAGIKPGNQRVYFGAGPLPGDTQLCENLVQNVRVCPQCGQPLAWEYRRYHHIGKARCPACGFRSPQADYFATLSEDGAMAVTIQGEEYRLPLPDSAPMQVYNSLAAAALLSEFGLSPRQLAEQMGRLTVSESRYSEKEVGGRKLILHMAKGQNPVACSRAFDNIRQYPGKKAAVLFLDDFFDAARSVENTAWLYDADFEFLAGEDVVQIVVAGARHWDVYLRLLMAGVDPGRVVHMRGTGEAAGALDPEKAEAVFILYDVYTIALANQVREQIGKRITEKAGGGRHDN